MRVKFGWLTAATGADGILPESERICRSHPFHPGGDDPP